MIARLSKIAIVGVLFIMLGLVQSSKTSLRGKDTEAPPPMEIVTMEEIVAMMEMEEFVEAITEDEEGGLRKLGDDTCWHGGQENQNLSWLGRTWGSCGSMSPCLCGLQPRQMAYWCPDLCRPSCGGSCATPNACPNGFNIENGQVVAYTGTIDWVGYPSFWPGNWGTQCGIYYNPGAPGATPAPTPAPTADVNRGTGTCGALNAVCNNDPCCAGLKCGMMLSDNNRYCGY